MTRAEFFHNLGKLKGNGWSITSHMLRCAQGNCPIVAVAMALNTTPGIQFRNDKWEIAACAIGLRLKDAEDIVNGADHYPEDLQYESYKIARLTMLSVLTKQEA